MKKNPFSLSSLLALVLMLSMVLTLSACADQSTEKSADEETNLILNSGEDGVITVTANGAEEGSAAFGYFTLKGGQSMGVETQLEGGSALLLQVRSGDGGDIDNPPSELTSQSAETEYLLEETVSGSDTYSFSLEPGAYTVLVTCVGNPTGTARIFPAGEAAGSAAEQNLTDYQSVLDEHPDDYYALVNLAAEQDVLLLSDAESVFGEEEKNSISASLYCVDANGAVQSVGEVQSGGTANPLAVSEGCLLYGGHKKMDKIHVDPVSCTLVFDAAAQIRYDKDGNESYFRRAGDSDWEEDPEGQTFTGLLEEYGNAVTVAFLPVTGE